MYAAPPERFMRKIIYFSADAWAQLPAWPAVESFFPLWKLTQIDQFSTVSNRF